MTSNEPYIGKNVGQLTDTNNSNDSNIITNNIKLDITKNQTSLNKTNENNENNKNDENDENENDASNTFWLNNPIILFDKNTITQLWPLENMTREQKINAITRLIILLTLIGFLFLNDIKILITGIIAILILIFTYYIYENATYT